MNQFTPFQQTLFYNTLYDRLPEDLQGNPYARQIVHKMTDIIVADFTIGKRDRGQFPYSQTLICHKLAKTKKYVRAVIRMYDDYKKDGELDTLSKGENDWFSEYLVNP